MLSPLSTQPTIASDLKLHVKGESLVFESQQYIQESQHKYLQNSNFKNQLQSINLQPESSNILKDAQLTIKSISEALILVFQQFIDHIEINKISNEEIKDQWLSLKQYLQPLNEQKVSDYFLYINSISKSNTTFPINSNGIPISFTDIPSYSYNISSNNNFTSNQQSDMNLPIQSMPIQTQNKISLANIDILNQQETIVSLNETQMKQQDINKTQNSITSNIFLNNIQSPSAPSLLPSSTYVSSTQISHINQQLQRNSLCNQYENASSTFDKVQAGQREDNSILCTQTHVSRSNSITSPAQPIISNIDSNNTHQMPLFNNQLFCSPKKDSTPNSPQLQKQDSLQSKNKKETSHSQFKAVPISTFKLDASRTNKSQLTLNMNQGTSQENSTEHDHRIISYLNIEYQNKRKSSQSKTRLQSPIDIQSHKSFIQYQRESLVRQASMSQDKQILQKMANENKQTITQLINEQEQVIYQRGTMNRSNTQYISKQLERREQQQLVVSSPKLQNTRSNVSSQTNTPLSQTENQNNHLSLNISYSQKNSPQQTQSSSNTNQNLQGISVSSNNQSSQKSQQNSSNHKSNAQSPYQLYNDQHLSLTKQPTLSKISSFSIQGSTRLSKQESVCQQDSLSTEESCKENEENSYFSPIDDYLNQKDQLDQNRKSENSKSIQSNGKSFEKASQNQGINLNSYSISSQYGPKQNLEKGVSPAKLIQNSKSLNKSKSVIQNSQGAIFIQNTNSKQNTESLKKVDIYQKNKVNSIGQLHRNSRDHVKETSSQNQNKRSSSSSKYSPQDQSMITIPSNFQAHSLKQKVFNLISLYKENNLILQNFIFK